MCKKLIYLVSFVLLLSVALTSTAEAELVGWWRFDEGSGTIVTDLSEYGNNGTLQGDPQWVNGKFGKALQFDGVDDYVEIPHADILTVDNEVTVMAWINVERLGFSESDNYQGIVAKSNNPRSYSLYTQGSGTLHFSTTSTATNAYVGSSSSGQVPLNEWVHVAVKVEDGGHVYYINGEPSGTGGSGIVLPGTDDTSPVVIGRTGEGLNRSLLGMIDDVRIYNEALTQEEIQVIMQGAGMPFAFAPTPADGVLHEDTWASLNWRPGDEAASHDVYIGENFNDVNDGAEGIFYGNQVTTFFVVGFPGFPYPEGLVPGTTYYWRIDETEADGTTIHKGDVWSFMVPPKTAYDSNPADGAGLVDPNVELSWTGGFGAKLHYVYFGDNFDDVNSAAGGLPLGGTSYTPGTLKLAKTYYWRVDEFDAITTYKGNVWSFATQGAIGSPYPSNGSVDVKQTQIITWSPGVYAASHQVYFGIDEDAVKNADTSSPEYKGTGDLGAASYDPGKLELDATYYWRIDEVNNVNPDSPWVGPAWSFTTADFVIVDDFEPYNDLEPADPESNRIFNAWLDGYGIPTNGSLVGYDNPPFAEQTIVHGGNQSMPLYYDNSVGHSEATLTLTYPRDWTENGVNTLSLWFRGNPAGFIEAPAGTYMMSASGADIWGQSDEFRFAWKQLSGVGSISAQLLSVENTDPWAKAGLMIRESLAPGSKFAFVFVSPANGCRFQARVTTDADAISDDSVTTLQGIEAPQWVKLERSAAGDFNAYNSDDGVTWSPLAWNPQRVLMSPNVYIGIALTSHNVNATGIAEFSNVQTTGTVSPMVWTHEAIGATMLSNDAEAMYVSLNGNALVYHDNPNAAQIDVWTEWNIDLQSFGVNLANVNTIALGLDNKNNPQAGGSGTMYFDDIRLYPPPPEPAP